MVAAAHAFALDLDIGIPITARPSPRDLQRASDARYVGLDLFPYHGKDPRPADWEERQWLSAFRHFGCDICCSDPHASFSYFIPRTSEDDGFALLAWLEAAEATRPGIATRVHALAVNFAGITIALQNLTRRQGKGKAH